MADTGWVYPTATGETASGGTRAWRNEINIKADDGSYADLAAWSPSNALFYNLYGKTYNFGIPTDATIDGIEVQVQAWATHSSYPATDENVQLYKGGSLGGTDKSTNAAWTYNSWVTRSYGGASDLWGRTWTPADLNNTVNFGVGFQPRVGFVGSGSSILRVDFIRVKVYYTEAASGGNNHGAMMIPV